MNRPWNQRILNTAAIDIKTMMTTQRLIHKLYLKELMMKVNDELK